MVCIVKFCSFTYDNDLFPIHCFKNLLSKKLFQFEELFTITKFFQPVLQCLSAKHNVWLQHFSLVLSTFSIDNNNHKCGGRVVTPTYCHFTSEIDKIKANTDHDWCRSCCAGSSMGGLFHFRNFSILAKLRRSDGQGPQTSRRPGQAESVPSRKALTFCHPQAFRTQTDVCWTMLWHFKLT